MIDVIIAISVIGGITSWMVMGALTYRFVRWHFRRYWEKRGEPHYGKETDKDRMEAVGALFFWPTYWAYYLPWGLWHFGMRWWVEPLTGAWDDRKP